MNRKLIKIIASAITKFNHFICTNFGISKESYRGRGEELGDNSQGNIFAIAANRDQSCFGFKQLEDQNLGAKYQMPITKQMIIKIAIGFVDDTDFYSNRVNVTEQIQEILNQYTIYHEVTSGKVSEVKTEYFCWQWKIGKR